MKIKINNFRGIKDAEFEADKITAIFGINYAGKTSLIQGVRAAITGETIPLDDVHKKHVSRLVHSGSATGSIEIDSGTGKTQVLYPDAKINTVGDVPRASGYAAGLESILSTTKERANIFAEYLKTLPSKEDLQKVLNDNDLVDRIWITIEAQGFDAAHETAKQKGTKLKGQWEMITGEKFGIRKAEAWTPAGLDISKDQETLKNEVQDAKEWLEAAIKYEAVNENELEKLRETVKKSDSILAERQNLENLLAGFEKTKIALESKLARDAGESIENCPHCHKEIIVTESRKLKKFKSVGSLDSKEIGKIRQDIIENKREIEKVEQAIQENAAESRTAADAMKKLDKLEKAQATEKPEKNIDDCRKALQLAEEKSKACEDYQRANKIKASIELSKTIVEILAPDGLRLVCLKEALSIINKTLKQLCKLSKWELVQVQDDLSITYNGMILGTTDNKSLCSKSEYYRAQILLQIALADLDNSDIILIDGADILDKPGRNGLLALLNAINIQSIVCFTWLDGREGLPDLKKLNGAAYWIEKGVLENV